MGRRDECPRLLATLEAEQPPLRQAFSRQQAGTMAATLKCRLLDAPKGLQKRYLQGLVTQIVVDQEKAVISGPPAAVAAAASAGDLNGGVRTSVRGWRAPPGEDDNYVYSIAL